MFRISTQYLLGWLGISEGEVRAAWLEPTTPGMLYLSVAFEDAPLNEGDGEVLTDLTYMLEERTVKLLSFQKYSE